ncbi:MAG: hypothetical protein AAF602_23315 [Myxococcota bacterium]
MMGFLGWLIGGATWLACSGDGRVPNDVVEAPEAPAPTEAPVTGDAPSSSARILSAYYGLDQLPPRVARICGLAGVRRDGMPVTFSVKLRADSIAPEDFAVTTAEGASVTPVCATLAPADEPLENRTILLAGTFGTPETPPTGVEVVGSLRDVTGATVQGLRTTTIVPLDAGPSLVLAERFGPATPGLTGECPPDTQQVVQLTWQGGVTGPRGAALGEAQRQAVSVTLDDGTTVTPVALADDDPDNFVHACLDVGAPARSVAVAAGHFHDPGDDANPATQTEVIDGIP